jgi:hypothetical protein
MFPLTKMRQEMALEQEHLFAHLTVQSQRFVDNRPLGFNGRDTNLYRYVDNSPTNATDPSGLQLFALGGGAKDALVKQLGQNGIDTYPIDLGNSKQEGMGTGNLYLILRGTKILKPDRYAHPEDVKDATNALGSMTVNKLFYAQGNDPNILQSTDLTWSNFSKEQRLQIFAANLLNYGTAAKDSLGYHDFKFQSWKQAGLSAVFAQVILKYGDEGRQFLDFAKAKKVRIEGDNDQFWFAWSYYSNGKIQIVDHQRSVEGKYETTVEQAADALYNQLKTHKEDIEEWSNRNYNDPSSLAQKSDHMMDPWLPLEPMPVHVAGRGGLAAGFDDLLTETASQVRLLMWDYALVGLNVRASAAARSAAMEREVSIWSSCARNTLKGEEKLREVAVSGGGSSLLLQGATDGGRAPYLSIGRQLGHREMSRYISDFLKTHFPDGEPVLLSNLRSERPALAVEKMGDRIAFWKIKLPPNAPDWVATEELFHLVQKTKRFGVDGAKDAFEFQLSANRALVKLREGPEATLTWAKQSAANRLDVRNAVLSRLDELEAKNWVMNQSGLKQTYSADEWLQINKAMGKTLEGYEKQRIDLQGILNSLEKTGP